MNLIKKFRVWLYYIRLKHFRSKLLKNIIKYSKTPSGEIFRTEANFLRENGVGVFPYPFIFNYNRENIKVKIIDGFPVVDYKGKDLFFPKSFSDGKIINYVHNLFLEQDQDSPHSYKTQLFQIDENDVLIDIGCGEANYSLEIIEKIKKVYLFESNKIWIEPLNRTFSNWENKVTIFNQKFGFQKDSLTNNFVNDLSSQNLLFKIDVDGNEREVLKSIEKLFLTSKNIKVAICTYHQNLDASEFETYFKSKGFLTQFGNGFMLFYYDRKIKKPYLRPGILFAYKK